MPSPEFVRLSVRGHVATVTLARPEALNAISSQLADELAGTLLQAAADPNAWSLVLSAEGDRAFCVGADLKERNRLDDRGWMQNRSLIRSLFDSLRAVPQPTIASVFGHALGGGFELALNCDLIVASEDAIFGLPEVTVGIVPGGGGTQQLARRVGLARAKELVLTGRRISANEAFEMGLVARVVKREELPNATMELAEQVCRSSPVAVREAKQAMNRGWALDLEAALEVEDLAWRRAVASDDRREGIAAFNEKRDPIWKGR
ncbi:MAG TPA: enoyl-CoA hydratase-related protein [Actinomycetota bacterium]